MRSLFTFVAVFLLLNAAAQSPGVSINSSGNDPAASSILDISSTTKGLLIPRMTTAERDDIESPDQALQIYNTTTKCFEFFESGVWNILSCGCTPPATPGPVTGSS